MDNWNKIVNCINSCDDIVILTHTNMDGDAVGSAAALCHALRKLKKNAVILIEDNVPKYLNVINNHPTGENDYPYFVFEMPYTARLAIAVDCADEARLEKRIDVFKGAEKRICIDHHLQAAAFADLSIVEPDIAATGMLIYKLISLLGVKFDTNIAEDLYVAIVTDTGRFRYSNTTAEVHQIVADLYKYGIDHVKICNAIYDSHPLSQIKAEAYAQDVMEIFAAGRAVISYITIDKQKELQATYEQTDTCIDRIRIIEGVEIAAFIKEKEPNLFKVSLRAKDYTNVNRVAQALGGGGHQKASGATLACSLDEAIAKLKSEIEKELDRFK